MRIVGIPRAMKCVLIWGLLGSLLLSGCESSNGVKPQIKNNKRNIWTQSNPRIQKFVAQYRSSSHLKTSLARAQDYLPYIHRVFRQYKLPPELAYLPLLESGFNPQATSPTGAKGLWQFTKATGEEYGLAIGWFKDERSDWRRSTWAAARYLDDLGRRFNYDWELALASYNSGPNYLATQIKQQKTEDYWNLELRMEGYQYVPQFLAMLKVSATQYPALYYTGAPKFWIAARD